ncbi:Ig-like domain-containing protein [Actinoplanes sp. DH11]|uniref:Ig-like domain-containing protein n=1 Tax=Actinoplanes sp. DH11 TaxID=2857011 RepID=UPI001E563FB4|nr:Ig-like domain-containing protein [Actinoplanes sp. DH11]
MKIGGLLLSAVLTAAIPVGIAAPATAAPAAPTTETALPDPTARGPYGHQVIQEAKFGLATIQEPNSDGGAPTAGTAAAPEQVEIRGQLYTPDYSLRTTPSPLIVLVHGNHGSCDSGQNSAGLTCAQFKHNESGYAYLAENLATWGYTTFSLSQDQLMMRQDNAKGKGMHNRRMLLAAALDAISASNSTAGLPVDEHTTIGTALSGHLDMTRIGLMGHSRGGDAVTNFIDYNRIRTDGPSYPIKGVISLAATDYERKAPYGMPFMSILPMCDGDVSNLMGARQFERGQTINSTNPYPMIQVEHLGAIHNWYNTVWYADGGADGQSNNDAACGNSAPFATNNIHPNNLRLSGAASSTVDALNYKIDNSDPLNPEVNTKISGDPERMGDQEKLGLATMAAFFRRYIGGEGAFDPYMTGELANTATGLQVPASACPTSESGTRIPCNERVNTSYFAGDDVRMDVIRPEVENPLTLNALGGALSGSGFANPYAQAAGVPAKPAATPGGYDWCNPEPDHFAPAQLGKTGLPTAVKQCPLPAATALGGQNGIRENAPVNHSYGRQLTLAWESDATAKLTAQIPADTRNMSDLESLALSAAVNFFDTRNPGADNRGDNTRDTTVNGTPASPAWPNEKPTSYDPASTTQNFVIALRDTNNREGVVEAGDPRWGNALHMSTGTNTPNTHIVLDQIRVPLNEFAAQGVNISSLASVEFRFGEGGLPKSGSIQMADVRFQESAYGAQVQSDGVAKADGAGHGGYATGAPLEKDDATPGNVWTVDDDRKQAPNAPFTSIQAAVEAAAPWDTILVQDGVYEESSTPLNHNSNPVQSGAKNGLTITKPLTIKGTGADKVTIKPAPSLGDLAGTQPYLRDGGGNVITVSRQSLGSTDTNEMFVDISGVTVTSGDTWVEAGIAYFGAAGRVANSVVGPLRTATTAAETTAHPHGWGIVKTGIIQGTGTGTVESELTVTGTLVKGFQSGGILFDGTRGRDGAPENLVRSGIRYHGYVAGTVVDGPGTGVKFTGGTDGYVTGSRISGLALADSGPVKVTGNVLGGVVNTDAAGTTARTDAPVTVSGSYLTGPVSAGGSVVLEKPLKSAPKSVPTGAGQVTDAKPTAVVASPGRDQQVTVGRTVRPLIRAADDFGVTSVTLLVDGAAVETSSASPYAFAWKPAAAHAGKKVALQGLVTDSAGNTRLSEKLTVSVLPLPVLTVGKVETNATAGTATVTAAVNVAGKVALDSDQVAYVSRTVSKAGGVTLAVTPTAESSKALARAGTLEVSATVTFEDTAGQKVSVPITLTLTLTKKK